MHRQQQWQFYDSQFMKDAFINLYFAVVITKQPHDAELIKLKCISSEEWIQNEYHRGWNQSALHAAIFFSWYWCCNSAFFGVLTYILSLIFLFTQPIKNKKYNKDYDNNKRKGKSNDELSSSDGCQSIIWQNIG